MNRLPSIRRWGVAALTGVTLFGGLSIVGAGAASAATPSVSAAYSPAVTGPATIAGAATAATAGFTLTVTGTSTISPAPDYVTLTLACPTSGTAKFTSATTVSGTFGATSGTVGTNSAGCSTFTIVATAAVLNPTIVVVPTIITAGVTSQALNIAGTYTTSGSLPTTFSAPVTANVVWYTVTSNTPSVTLPGTGTTAVSPITITDPANISGDYQIASVPGAADSVTNAVTGTSTAAWTETGSALPNAGLGTPYATSGNTLTITAGTVAISSVTVTGLPTGMTASIPSQSVGATAHEVVTLSGTPTVAGHYSVLATAVDTAGSATAAFTMVVAPAVVDLTLDPTGTDKWNATTQPTVNPVGGMATVATTSGSSVMVLTVTTVPAANYTATFTINGASVVTSGEAPGQQTATVTFTNALGGSSTMAVATVGTILGSVTTIFGADGTADGTVAAEFENSYPAIPGTSTSGNRSVVLATDAAHTNGSDALAASYLEGTLNTGLLITPSSALGVDAQNAMRIEGVSTVYVVGGPLAVSPAVIAQIEALPVYNPGGLTATSNNVKVVGPIFGADGTAAGTAAAIASYFGTAYGSGYFPAAYTSNGLGAYNDTTGVGSTTGPSTALPTAIVVASSDWQDAMSIAPEAFSSRFPVILAGPSSSATLGTDASAALTALGVKQVIVIGGQLALANTVEAQIAALNGGISVLRIAGIDATDTAAQIANFAWSTGGTNSGLGWTAASGKNSVLASHADYWSDALGAASLGGGANQATFGTEPILLVESPTVIGSYTTAELAVAANAGVTGLNVLGGPLAMPSTTVQTLLAGL